MKGGEAETSRPRRRHIVVIGASTGGPDAIRSVLGALPPDSPPILIVQHMPEPFTAAFAGSLDEESLLRVREARDGDPLIRGRALVAPGGRHMSVQRTGAGLRARLSSGPLVSRHCPSIDVLFGSVAEVAGRDAVGVLLSGMGVDGAEGLFQMRLAGATTMVQDRATSVVFGMAKAAIDRGAVQLSVPLERIAALLLRPRP